MARKKRRAGGSKARREIRQKSEIKNVVTPGLEGGKYNPLSTQEIEKITAGLVHNMRMPR